MEMQNKIVVVGIGPGNPDYIVPKGLKAIEQAKFLVGGRRALNQFAADGQETCPITADIQGVMDFIRAKVKLDHVVAMVSGDPGYYSLLDALRRDFPAKQITVIPGISAMQYAFARLALPWHDATLASFHGRTPAAQDMAYKQGKILGLLTDSKYNSQTIAEILLQAGWPQTQTMHICSRLSYDDEKVVTTTLGEAINLPAVTHCILIIA